MFYWEGSGDRLGEKASLPAPTAAAALPTIVSSLGGSFCVHATFCLSRKRAPPSRRTRSCGYILRPALQPPSSPQNMPPLAGWLLRYNARQSTQLKQAGKTPLLLLAAAGCVSVRVSRREFGAAFKRGWLYSTTHIQSVSLLRTNNKYTSVLCFICFSK